MYKCQNSGCDSEYREYEYHSYTEKTVAPTCTEQGYTLYTCTCGHQYKDNFVPAIGHTLGAEATCETAKICTTCRVTLVPALGHDWKAATCTEPQTCQRPGCGAIGDSATGHTYSEYWSFNSEKHYHLAICGCVDEEGKPFKSQITNHTLDNNKCLVCNYIEQQKLATPVIKTEGLKYDKVTWEPVENAVSYTVIVNGNYTYTLQKTAKLEVKLNAVTDGNNEKIKDPGYVYISVRANGDEKYYSNSDSSAEVSYYYVPESDSVAKAEIAKQFKIGCGYNLIEDPYLDTKKYASFEILNVNKLLTIGDYVESRGTAGTTNYYFYSSIGDYLLKTQLDGEINTGKGASIPIVEGLELIGSIETQFNASLGVDFSTHQYFSTFIYEIRDEHNDRRIVNFVYEDLEHCLSETFLQELYKESDKTRGMSDSQLIEYLYNSYGTHVILGVNTGGSYVAQYTVATNNVDIALGVEAGFKHSVGFSISDLISKNFGISADLQLDIEGDVTNTTTSFKTYYFGGSGKNTITTNMSDYGSASNAWEVTNDNATAYGFTKDGAISIAYLISLVKPALAQKFEEYINQKSTDEYNRLFSQYSYSSKTDLDYEVIVENGINVLKIDLRDYQEIGNLDNVKSSILKKNIMTIEPRMMGKRIDKIVIEGKFDEYPEKLINSFSIQLTENWNSDVVVELRNLGVICTSNLCFIDILSNNCKATIEYVGVNAVQYKNGLVDIYHSINENYNFKLTVRDGETIDFTTMRISSTVYLPIVHKDSNTFIGWFYNSTQITDSQGKVLDSINLSSLNGMTLTSHIASNLYKLSDDGTYYIVTGISDNTVSEIIIPSTFGELPVKEISSSAFYNNKNVVNIQLPNTIATIGNYAFYGCSKLKTINIPNSVTKIGQRAFYGCSSLTGIKLGSGLKRIESETFYNCTSLKTVEMEDQVTYIGSFAFYNCVNMSSIKMSRWIETIEYNAFSNCSSIKSIGLYESLTYIGEDAFNGCSSLESVVIPDRMTYIGQRVFARCTSLRMVYIPKSVTFIDNGAFDECSSLNTIHYSGSDKDWYDGVTIGERNSYLLIANMRFGSSI